MPPYIPVHLRKKPETRRKVIVVPKINSKYVLVRNRKSGDLTFIGGGCSLKNNIKNCALRELREESKNSIKLRNINNYKKRFLNKTRAQHEQNNNNARRLNVTLNYHVFVPNISNKNFNTIKRNFNAYRGTNKKYLETSNILLMSKNNLNNKDKYFIVNLVSPRLP